MKMLSFFEVVVETIVFYTKNPLSVIIDNSNTARCVYKGPNNMRCAFSRCCTDDSKFNEGMCCMAQDPEFYTILPQYKLLSMEQWKFIQMIHDTPILWDKSTKGFVNEFLFVEARKRVSWATVSTVNWSKVEKAVREQLEAA